MVNCDCESFGIYRIIKCFIYQSASLYCDFEKFWTPHFFLTPHFFVWTPQFGWTPRLNYTMLQKEVSCLAFLANTLSTSSGVGQCCDSVCLCLRLRPMARTQLHFPISSRPIVGIGLTDFYPKKISHRVWTSLRGLTWASPEVAEARDPNGR